MAEEAGDGAAYDPTGQNFTSAEYAYDQQDGDEEDDDYDPLSFQVDGDDDPAQATESTSKEPTAEPTELSAQNAQPTQIKTMGGFVVDSDDEEDEQEQGIVVPPPSQMNGANGAQSGLGAVAVSEASQDVPPIASEAPQDTAAVPLAQTAQTPLNASVPEVSNEPVVPTSASASSVLPNAPPVQSPPAATASQGKQEQIHLSTTDSAAQSVTATPQPPAANSAAAPPPQTNGSVPHTPTTQRLPHDKVGQLEDRIKEDPKGDTDAWRSLIAHYKEKGQLDNVRKVYSRFFDVFPSAASMWVEFTQMELEQEELKNVEHIFGMSLRQVQSVDMWNLYLDYLRRVFPLINDTDGSRRGILLQAFETVLDNVGIDPESGKLWRDYVDFVKSGPGTIGGTGWQDAQKVDLLRKAYQRAVKLPHSELTKLWKEYDNFELGINKATGRKFLQEQSPHYMQARTAKTQIDQKIEGLDRTSLPKLPPLYGCAGDDEFMAQVEKFKAWIAWEKEDPLVFKDEDIAVYRKRILYAYKQATTQLRFYPDIWFDAITWCFEQGTEELVSEGEELLNKGVEANPESVLLTLKKADRLEETSLEAGNTDEVLIRNGEKLDVPFEKLHTALYALHKKMQERTTKTVDQIKQYYAGMSPEEPQNARGDADDDSADEKPKTRNDRMNDEIAAYRASMQHHLDALKRVITSVWVAKLRAFRRIQGQGAPKVPKKGLRGVFAEARPRGQLTSDVYVASALIEWNCYRDPSAEKIFDRGLKLFPTDEVFTLEYIKFLINKNDYTNARVVFETTLTKISTNVAEEEKQKEKSRALLGFMHSFESSYGDLDKIQKLEKRMKEMFPQEPEIVRFSNRFQQRPSDFDAVDVQLIISPTQAMPKPAGQQPITAAPQQPVPSIEQPGRSPPQETGQLRLGPNGPYVASPKRALEDSDSEAPQRKFMRGESPLKGAAGRRIQNQSGGASGSVGGPGFMAKPPLAGPPPVASGPPPLPATITHLLSIIPRASAYNNTRFDAEKMVEFLRGVNLGVARLG